jgi:antitoxin component HigA of HigAB toxin-antitoxin module
MMEKVESAHDKYDLSKDLAFKSVSNTIPEVVVQFAEDEMEVLVTLIEAYEHKHYPMGSTKDCTFPARAL